LSWWSSNYAGISVASPSLVLFEVVYSETNTKIKKKHETSACAD
jgi:hypothetical protein